MRYIDEKGIYHLKTTAGEYTLVVSAIGYQTVEKKVKLARGERIKVNVTIAPAVKELGEVLVTCCSFQMIYTFLICKASLVGSFQINCRKIHHFFLCRHHSARN